MTFWRKPDAIAIRRKQLAAPGGTGSGGRNSSDERLKRAGGAAFEQELAGRREPQTVDLAAEFSVEVGDVEGEQPIRPGRERGDDDRPVLGLREEQRLSRARLARISRTRGAISAFQAAAAVRPILGRLRCVSSAQ